MLTLWCRCLHKKRVKKHLSMTGEITLRGKVLPVAESKKDFSSKATKIKEIILSESNRKDIEEIKEDYLKVLPSLVKEMHIPDLAITDQGKACESIVAHVYSNLCPHCGGLFLRLTATKIPSVQPVVLSKISEAN